MKRYIPYFIIGMMGIVVGVSLTWLIFRSHANDFATNSCFERIASNSTLLGLIRDKAYDEAVEQLELDLSANLLYVSACYPTLSVLPKKELRLLKLAARERSIRPFQTGDKSIDPVVENLLAKVQTQ